MEKLPNDVLEKIFLYVDAETLFGCAMVCKRWSEVLEGGDSKIWRKRFYLMELDHDIFEYTNSDLIKDLPHFKAKVRAYYCAWSEDDCSETFYMKEDFLTFHRNPVAKSTDSIRSKVGFKYGRHKFVIIFHGPQLGSNAMVGVCNKEASLRIRKYDNLLGLSPNAWGWDLVNNKLLHNNEELGTVEGEKAKVNDKIGLILDIEEGTLHFEINGIKKEACFTNISKDRPLYPTISAVFGNSEMSMVYHGKPIE